MPHSAAGRKTAEEKPPSQSELPAAPTAFFELEVLLTNPSNTATLPRLSTKGYDTWLLHT